MKFVKLNRNEIRAALDLVWAVFQEFEAPDYSEQGIEEYRKFILSNCIIERFNKKELQFWGCIDNDNLIGVIAIRGINHISMLFVDKNYHRRGIARSLIQIVKDNCKSNNSVRGITVNSSPYAIEFYHRLGFADTDKEQTMDGIRFTPMSYLL